MNWSEFEHWRTQLFPSRVLTRRTTAGISLHTEGDVIIELERNIIYTIKESTNNGMVSER